MLPQPHPFRLLGVTATALALAALAGCGGSGSFATQVQPGQVTSADQGAEAKGTSLKAGGGAGAAQAGRSAVGASGPVVKATGTGGNDENTSTAKPLNPCTLVRTSELATIAHTVVMRSTEAPLGPTCVYTLSGKQPDITLALESVRFGTFVGSIADRREFRVARHIAYCGTLGHRLLIVSVSRGTALNIAAPCNVAVPLARKALTRLAS